jgi:hypothetical protein
MGATCLSYKRSFFIYHSGLPIIVMSDDVSNHAPLVMVRKRMIKRSPCPRIASRRFQTHLLLSRIPAEDPSILFFASGESSSTPSLLHQRSLPQKLLSGARHYVSRTSRPSVAVTQKTIQARSSEKKKRKYRKELVLRQITSRTP